MQKSIYAVALALLVLCSCKQPHDTADMILTGGKIITVDDQFSIAEGVAIKDGRIMAVGKNKDILHYAGNATEVIDLKGRVVIPGLIEGHAHPVGAATSEYEGEIPDLDSIDDLLTWIRQEAASKRKGEWIVHPKFFITRLRDMRQVTLQELDNAAPDHPVFLNGSYGGVVNTKALEVSGLLSSKHEGILRDRESGEATGMIRRSVFNLLKRERPRVISEEEERDAIRTLFQEYNKVGITTVTCGHGSSRDVALFRDMAEKGDLTVRIFQHFRFPTADEGDLVDAIEALGTKTGAGDDWVRIGALKVVVDGGVLTGTAFMREGWGPNAEHVYGITDPSYRGELMLSRDQLARMIEAAAETGWKFTAHVTGGGGVDTLLDAFYDVHQITPIEKKRFSIIHGNFYTADAISNMAAMGIIADMQPAWFLKDTDLLHHVLGAERLATFHPYRSMLDAGVVVVGGSDHMVKVDPDKSINPYNPFLAMWSIVTRNTSRGKVYNPEQAITREEALRLYTINNAYSNFEENLKGSIEPGKLADLVVLSDDPLTCPEDSIPNIKALLTVVGGKKVVELDWR